MLKPILLAQDTISQQHLNSLAEWLMAGPAQLTKGPVTLEFERRFAERIGTKYSVFVNSGSSALLLMLAALIERGICKFNKKVVVPAVSWSTDVSSIILLGLEPILVDCNLQNLSVDLNHLEDIFRKEEPSALLLVSILGLPPDMKEIQELCSKYHVALLEDNCESFGSKYDGRNLGTFGVMSAFSSYYGHTYSTIEGGCISTDSDDYYNLLVMLRSHGWSRDCLPAKQEELRVQYQHSKFEEKYKFYIPAFNVRNTDIGAFLGLLQLDVVDEYIRVRNENYLHWMKNLPDHLWKPVIDQKHFVASFALPFMSTNREEIVRACDNNAVEVRPLVAGSFLKQPMYYKRYSTQYQLRKFGHARLVDSYGMYAPNHQSLTTKDVNRMIEIVRSVCEPE